MSYFYKLKNFFLEKIYLVKENWFYYEQVLSKNFIPYLFVSVRRLRMVRVFHALLVFLLWILMDIIGYY